jgi:hypothetical protein
LGVARNAVAIDVDGCGSSRNGHGAAAFEVGNHWGRGIALASAGIEVGSVCACVFINWARSWDAEAAGPATRWERAGRRCGRRDRSSA